MELLDILQDTDFDRLCALRADDRGSRIRARILMNTIVRRMQRPRAYLADLAHVPEEQELNPSAERVLWHEGRDLASRELQLREIRVIDSATIRQIARLCEPLSDLTDDYEEPMARMFLGGDDIDELWLPRYGVMLRRHTSLASFAKEKGAAVRFWYPEHYRVPKELPVALTPR